jgi:hypothetical protein
MTDAAKRALRTFIQGFLGVLALIAVPALNDLVQAVAGGGEVEIDVNVWRGILLAAVAGGIIALISWAQNTLENTTSMLALLKDQTPAPTAPQPRQDTDPRYNPNDPIEVPPEKWATNQPIKITRRDGIAE